jgi:hypothetical protein
MIRVKATHDGTYTVYRDDRVLVAGLTRQQADHFSQSPSDKSFLRLQAVGWQPSHVGR